MQKERVDIKVYPIDDPLSFLLHLRQLRLQQILEEAMVSPVNHFPPILLA